MTRIADDALAFGTTVLALLLLALVTIALGAAFRWLQKWRARKSTLHEVRVFDLTGSNGEVASDAQALRLKVVFREAVSGASLVTPVHSSELGEALPRWRSLAENDLSTLAEHLDTDAKISVGPISLPLKAVWSAISRVLIVPRYRWTAVVRESAGLLRISLRLDDHASRETTRWSVEVPASEPGAVDEGYRQLALKCWHFLRPPTQGTPNPDAFLAFHDGARALASGDLELARARLEAAWRLMPDDPRVAVALATALRRSGERETAMLLLDKVSSSGGAPSVEVELQRALLWAQSHTLDKVWKAYETFDRLCGNDPSAFEGRACLLDVCVTLVADPDFGAAKDDRRHPELAPRIEQLGREFLGSPPVTEGGTAPIDRSEQNRRWLEARGYALYALGKYRLHQERFDEALDVLRWSLLCSGESLPAYVAVARTARAAGNRIRDWERVAERALGLALKLNPDDPAVNYQLGRFNMERSAPNVAKAAEHLEKVAARWAAGRYQLGRLKAQTDPVEGARLIGEAIQRSTQMPAYYAEGIRECLANALKAAAAPAPDGGSASAVEALARALLGNRIAVAWVPGASEKLRSEATGASVTPSLSGALRELANQLIEINRRGP